MDHDGKDPNATRTAGCVTGIIGLILLIALLVYSALLKRGLNNWQSP